MDLIDNLVRYRNMYITYINSLIDYVILIIQSGIAILEIFPSPPTPCPVCGYYFISLSKTKRLSPIVRT